MISRIKKFFFHNWKMVTVFLFATLFDAYSTAITILKPGTEELNPLGAALIQPEATLHTTLYLSTPPMLLLLLILGLWVRADVTDYWETILEAAATIQIAAGINNTLIYSNIFTPIPILVLAAMVGHYATRLQHIRKREKSTRSLRERLPTTPFSET